MNVHLSFLSPPKNYRITEIITINKLLINLYLVICKIKGFCQETLDIPYKGNSYNSNK